MISKPMSTMTGRIANLIRVHESGQIDDAVYSRELKALQDEFLSPEPLNPEPLNHAGLRI